MCFLFALACGCGGASAVAPNAPTDAAASRDGDPSPLTCPVALPTACAAPERRYADLAPIFEHRCVPCHAGAAGGPWPLTDYQSVADWYDIIRDDLARCTMPPADGGIALPADERETILDWIRCGFPQ